MSLRKNKSHFLHGKQQKSAQEVAQWCATSCALVYRASYICATAMCAQGYPHFSAQQVAQLVVFLKCESCVRCDVCFHQLRGVFRRVFGLEIAVENASDARCLSLCEGSVFD